MKNKITAQQYAILLYEITSGEANIQKKIKSFLGILVKNNDIGKIDDIIKEFEKYDKKQRGIKDVEIISAKPMAKEIKDQITEIFKSQGKIDFKETINPELIAGLVVIFGDMMIDGSLRKKIRDLNKSLLYG